ncbi:MULTISPECIES: TadE/TadG family type IV pilus assembly protein [unclassified Roseibium]|uniref:TadE/TadG family type IV pilus assembly protein n=1 Tax=unclassified Roseibium TaxID=2629323 RepID=UPI00273FF505|nr:MULTISPECIES: TadE family protein [unclassified Roseibium]
MYLFRRFWTKRDGATAIEFALIGMPFFLLFLSCFEMGLLFIRMTMLDHAVNTTSKTVYIGAITQGLADNTVSREDFEEDICEIVGLVVPDCVNNLTIELIEISSLIDLPDTDAVCVDASSDFRPVVTFNPGSANSIVFMRACLTTDIYTPGLGFGLALSKTVNNRYEMVSSMAFMNEPF